MLHLRIGSQALRGHGTFTCTPEILVYGQMLGLLLRRPTLLPALVGLAWVSRRRGWYRAFPFLPLPPAGFLKWRNETAYGRPDALPPAEEASRYLRWARRMRQGR